MAVEKLALVVLSGPVDMVDLSLQTFVINREFHPVNAINHLQSAKTLLPFDLSNPHGPLLETAKELARDLEIPLDYQAFDLSAISEAEVDAYLRDLSARVTVLKDERNRLNLTVADNQNMIRTLTHIRGVDKDIDDIYSMRATKFRFGRMPRNVYYDAYQRLNARADAFFIHTSIEDDYVYGMYFTLPSAEEQVDAFFASLKFERIWIPEKIHGTAQQAMAQLTEETLTVERQAAQLTNKLGALREIESTKLLSAYSYLRFLHDAFALRSFAGHSAERFYIVGWAPKSTAREYAEALSGVEDFSCDISLGRNLAGMTPPIKQRSDPLIRVFAPFVEMYGLPSYREIDPTLFMTITYTLLFGVMFGDVGQGVVLLLFGLFLYRAKDMWLGRILACAGVSATAFGFVYGSVFGFEEILPGFHVMEGSNILTMLLISAAIGAAMICFCMVLNILNGIRERDIGKILFSPNGAAGLVFYAAVLAGGIALPFYQVNLFSTPYVALLIVLPLLLIMGKDPLSKLLRGQKDWKPESVGGFFIEGFFELFETILSYISNTISFLRVGAFAIVHAGMMQVVFMLAGTASGGYNPVVLIIGNLFVMGLETLLVCIQLLRLEFYEMFGRFYTGGGEKFAPRIIDYRSGG